MADRAVFPALLYGLAFAATAAVTVSLSVLHRLLEIFC